MTTHPNQNWEAQAQIMGEELGDKIFRDRNKSTAQTVDGYHFMPYLAFNAGVNNIYMSSCDVVQADGNNVSLFDAVSFVRARMNGAFVFREPVVASVIDAAMRQIRTDVEVAVILDTLFDDMPTTSSVDGRG